MLAGFKVNDTENVEIWFRESEKCAACVPRSALSKVVPSTDEFRLEPDISRLVLISSFICVQHSQQWCSQQHSPKWP